MKRFDVEQLLIGKGNYIDDYPFKGKYAIFVRSPYPHALIRNIDASDAIKHGAQVLTGKDIMAKAVESGDREGASLSTLVIATKKALYVGQPVALVLANDPYEATDLAELVQVDYEPLEPIPNIEKALKGEVYVFDELKTNIVKEQTFEFGKISSQGKHLELDLYWSKSSGNPIEPFGAIIYPKENAIEIISNLQAGNAVLQKLKEL